MNSSDREAPRSNGVVNGLAGLAAYLLFGLFHPAPSVARAANEASFQVAFPEKAHTGEPIKIHVRFTTKASPHAFYRLQIDVDGQPVAMADMSDERSSWITLEPQSAGRHRVSITWRNPPGASPISQSRTLVVSPGNSPGPASSAKDGKH